MVASVQDSFVERLSASQLLEKDQLVSLRTEVGDDETALVDRLLGQNLLTRFQVRQLRAGATSFFIGKYVVVDCIGRGGNGIVYKARHRLINQRYVALKTMDTRSLHHDSEAVERFRREIDIVASLDHPNVVRALDVLQTRSHLYLVLEYVPGQDLAKVVQTRGPLPIAEAAACGLQTACALHYAHGQGIVHRDLKPANLLLAPDGTVKLSDLGLARLFKQPEKDNGLTVKGLCMGTPEFMAPEQAEDASQAGPASDLYSLGATLFHLVTAELPLSGSSYLHRIQQLLTAPQRSLRVARPDAPPAFADLVDRLRLRDPKQRPASAQEVMELLKPFVRKAAEDDPARWDAKRKVTLVLDVLRGQSCATVGTQHGVTANLLESWYKAFLDAGEQALNTTNRNGVSPQEQIRDLHRRVGAQAMELEILRKRLAELS